MVLCSQGCMKAKEREKQNYAPHSSNMVEGKCRAGLLFQQHHLQLCHISRLSYLNTASGLTLFYNQSLTVHLYGLRNLMADQENRS